MILGTILVLLTWVVAIVVICIPGIAISLWLKRNSSRPLLSLDVARHGLWWGFAICLVVVLAMSLGMPLTSAPAAIVFTGVVFISAVSIILQRPIFKVRIKRPHPLQWAVLVGISASVLYLSFAALGPVTNYDSGLYHLGAIKYASEYSTISGLANLYFPFGYNTGQYPLAAFLGNGPWGPEGYRLLNGLIVSLFATDLALRLLAARGSMRNFSSGTWILIVGAPVMLIPLVALADYWVTSPSSDAPVMILTFIAAAYLADGVSHQRNRVSQLAIAFVVAVILFSLRPTTAIYLVGLTLVTLFTLFRFRRQLPSWRSLTPLFVAGGVGVLVLIVQTVRDYFLSGWFQFPLSVYSFDTPWTASDPIWNRAATLGNARNSADIWGSVDGFNWVLPWVGRLPSQWETYLVSTLIVGLILIGAVTIFSHISIPWRIIGIVTFPSIVSTLAWFLVSPPAFRFGWGFVFSLFVAPIGILLQRLSGKDRTGTVGRLTPQAVIMLSVVGILMTAAFSATMRLPKLLDPQPESFSLGPINLEYEATPVQFMPVADRSLQSGLLITVPTESDQCWDNYPLCTPIVSETVIMRERNIQSGFLP